MYQEAKGELSLDQEGMEEMIGPKISRFFGLSVPLAVETLLGGK